MKSTPAPRRVLVAPLDWGLGHATRCIPVIRELLAAGCGVVLAAQGPTAGLLRQEFPALRIVPIINYGITYAATPFLLALKFPLMLARVFYCAAHERRRLARIITDEKIDTVLSDNRFGCHHKSVYCVYLSHQLYIKVPPGFGILGALLWAGHRHAILNYDELWIPDFPGDENLTGDLTRKYPLPAHHRFVGPLSRFEGTATAGNGGEGADLLVMLSGPEPQRSALEKKILSQLASCPGNTVVLSGRHGRGRRTVAENVTLVTGASTAEIGTLLAQSRAIICRGGFTTIMELVSLGKTAVLVPTPGQTEQEYLCRRLAAQGRFVVAEQRALDINDALAELGRARAPAGPRGESSLLRDAVRELASRGQERGNP